MDAGKLHTLVAEVCPIDSVSIGDLADKATWRIDYKPEATAEQIVAAEQAVAALDHVAIALVEKERRDGIRADTRRKALLEKMETASLLQIKTFVQGQIDVASVTDLASAKACLGRMEQAIVDIVLLVALDRRNGDR